MIDRTAKYKTWDGGPPLAMPQDATAYSWPTAGTAFDYRLRFFLGTTELYSLVAYQGTLSFGSFVGAPDGSLKAFEQARMVFETVKTIDRDWATSPSDETNLRLAEISFVLALYEQCFRAVMSDEWPLVKLGSGANYEDVVGLAHPSLIDDLQNLSVLFRSTQSQLLHSKLAILNPTFGEASLLLGGADADLIVDGRLIDIKTRKVAQLDRVDLWQLLGYALADFDDHYEIEEVGFYFSRHGIQVAWDLSTLMRLLSGDEQNLFEVRENFRQVLLDCQDSRISSQWPGFDILLSTIPSGQRPSYFPAPIRDKEIEVVKNVLVFRPTTSGKGKWHVAYSENPYTYTPKGEYDRSTTPSCGTPGIVIDRKPVGLRLKRGEPRGDYSKRCCAKCLEFSGRWHVPVSRYAVPEIRSSDSWKFREPVNPRLKWHIARADFYRENRRSTIGLCNAGEAIKLKGMAYKFGGVETFEEDVRFCRHCLRQARQALATQSALDT